MAFIFSPNLLLTLGRWHSFVDTSEPANPYLSSIWTLNNSWCHAGNHIAHHAHPNRHWSKIPNELELLPKSQCHLVVKSCAAVFKLEPMDEPLLWLMTNDFARLASRLASPSQTPMAFTTALADILRLRTLPWLAVGHEGLQYRQLRAHELLLAQYLFRFFSWAYH